MTVCSDKVSINILHYNSFEKTKKCITSCLRQNRNDIKIVVIDNHSTNDSLEKLKKCFEKYDIDYLENQDNYGFAKGNNIGVKYVYDQGIKYSLLLNNDTELIGCCLLSRMLQVMDNVSDCSVVAPQIYDVTSSGLVLIENDSVYLKMLRMLKVLPKNKSIDESLLTISEAQGSALLVDNEQFIKVGGFPEHYYMYGEEGTFSKRVLWDNKTIIWYKDQNNYVLHHHDKSANVDPWRLYLMGRNRGIEFYENYKRNPLWIIAYIVFYMKCMLQRNKNLQYLKGMQKARILNMTKVDSEQCYLDGYLARERYRGDK